MDWISLMSDWGQVIVTGAAAAAVALWTSIGRRDGVLQTELVQQRKDFDARFKELDTQLNDRLQHQGQRIGGLEIKDAAGGNDINQRLIRIEERQSNTPAPQVIASHSERLTRIEEIVSRAPSHEHLTAIYEAINPLRESIATIKADMNSQADSLRIIRSGVDRMNTALLHHFPDIRTRPHDHDHDPRGIT